MDSSGGFTVSAERALQKLSKFGLTEPWNYVLHLVSGGILAGPESFSIDIGHWRSILRFPGADLPFREIKEPFNHLMVQPRSTVEWALRELAIGLHTAPTGGVSKINLIHPEAKVSIKGERVRVYEFSEPLAPGLELLLYHDRPVLKLFTHLFKRRGLPEYEILKSTVISPGLEGSITDGRHQFQVPFVEDIQPDTLHIEAPLAITDFEDGWVSLGRQNTLGKGKNSKLVLVIRGRKMSLPMKMGRAQVVAFIRADHLQLNISQSAPVHNHDYLEVRRRVNSALLDLQVKALANEKLELTPRDKRVLGRQLCRSLRSLGRLPEALSVLQSFPTDNSRRAAVLFQMGDVRKAEATMRLELDEPKLPKGLKPSRLIDLAVIVSRAESVRAFSLWKQGHEMLVEQHMSRKSHLVAESLEKLLYWLAECSANDKVWEHVNSYFEEKHSPLELWAKTLSLKKHLGARHVRLGQTRELGAYLYLRHGQFDMALEQISTALSIAGEHYGAANPILGRPLALKTLILREVASREAVVSAQQRMQLMTSVYGNEHPEVGASLALLSILGGTEAESQLNKSTELLSECGIEQSREAPIICFRAWFHSRSAWGCRLPLRAQNVSK